MNLEQLQSMSDDELNGIAAVEVMGWKRDDNKWCEKIPHEFFNDYVEVKDYFRWNPTNDMNDAMELLSGFRNVRMSKNHSGGWIVSIGSVDEFDPLLPRAITVAAILEKTNH